MTAAVLIVIGMVVLGEYTKDRGRALFTALVFAAYFFVSLGPVWVAQRRPGSPRPGLPRSGLPRPGWAIHRLALGFGVAALLLLLAGTWGTPNSDAFWKSVAIVTALALVLAYVAVVEFQQGSLTRGIAVKAVALAALMACLGIAAGIEWPPYWWAFTVAVLVWAGAVLAGPVLYLGRRIQRR